MPLRRWLAIVNPRSGGCRSARFRRRWLSRLESMADIVLTEAPGHATALAAGARGYGGIVAVGGDGTVLEVVAGLDRSLLCLAVLPAGRGNSLARDLVGGTMAGGLAALGTGATRAIDLISLTVALADGSVRQVLAASTVALGYVTNIVACSPRPFAGGQHAYLATSAFVRPRPFTLRIGYDGGTLQDRQLTGLVLSNTRHLANLVAFPAANCGDGRFETMELRAGWLRQIVHNASLLIGPSLVRPAARETVRNVTVELPRPTALLLDGEILEGVTALRAHCQPRSLLCRASQGAR